MLVTLSLKRQQHTNLQDNEWEGDCLELYSEALHCNTSFSGDALDHSEWPRIAYMDELYLAELEE